MSTAGDDTTATNAAAASSTTADNDESVAASTTTTTSTTTNNNDDTTADQLAKEENNKQRRREIQSIMKDTSLSELERRLRIQNLMGGGNNNKKRSSATTTGSGEAAAASTSNNTNAAADVSPCIHYERKCNILSPCCNKIFGCRLCHDEFMEHNHHHEYNSEEDFTCTNNGKPMDRFGITQIICKECDTVQDSKTNVCSNVECGVTFGEYHCPTCNLWMALSKRPFHCNECGFCRVGGMENFRHCAQCCMCVAASVYETHNCMTDKYKNACPVCREDMFISRQSPQDLPCGHAIHAHCFRNLAGFDYRCPICKKTVVSQDSMSEAWAARANDIVQQPMPVDLARVVNIMCNDCEVKSSNCNWHFLGVQCPGCSSFNTVVEQVVGGGGGDGEGGSS